MDMSKKVKIICDDIEYKLEMQDDKTILELALEMILMLHTHVKEVYVVLVLQSLIKVL